MLIHGLGASYRVWDRVVPLLELARTIAVHLESNASIERDADDAAALIDSPVVAVGHSRGGLVATALAERRPELVSKLILLCSPWSVASRHGGAGRPIERALAVPGIGDLLWTVASTARQRAGLRSAFAPGTVVPDQFVTDLRERGRANLVHSSRAINDYLTVSPLAERLNNLAVPTELVFGTQDARVAAPHGAFAHLAQAHLIVLPGIGHTPPWEAPDQVAELITAALPAGSQNK
jgi:pimeloyl-ACP methyl ester carboxylesterase